MRTIESDIPYNYVTIRLTQSRVEKGLLAIPVSLIDNFPQEKTRVNILFDDDLNFTIKNFTPYESSSRECRIGGMSEFYEKHKVKAGSEIVIQFLGEHHFRIITEDKFKMFIKNYEAEFDTSTTEQDADEKIKSLVKITNIASDKVAASEFMRLSCNQMEQRKQRELQSSIVKESTPPSIRRILKYIYKGKCQITDFSFIMKNGEPYFEIHHINPDYSHHLKNLLVVCPNVHAQFEFTNVREYFDKEGWLRKVKFNEQGYEVIQSVDSLEKKFKKEVHIFNQE